MRHIFNKETNLMFELFYLQKSESRVIIFWSTRVLPEPQVATHFCGKIEELSFCIKIGYAMSRY
jgi:hypothetical protein